MQDLDLNKIEQKTSNIQKNPIKMVFRKRILFLGDDLYYCWTDEEFAGHYVFDNIFDPRLHQIYGVKDGTINLWKKYLDIEIPKYEKPKYIFLSLGLNDLKESDYDIDAVVIELIDFLKVLHSKYENVEIFLSTLIHYPINVEHREDEIEFNQWIFKHAADYNYNVIDNANIIEKRITNDNFDDVFYHDYSHIGPLGYEIMNAGLQDIKKYNLIDDDLLELSNKLNGGEI